MKFLSFYLLAVSMLSFSSVASEQQGVEVDNNKTPVETSSEKKVKEKNRHGYLPH